MAKFVFKDAFVSINGTAISDHCSSVTVEDTADEIDFTAFTANSYREFGQGLKDANITLSVFQDYAGSSVYSIFQPLYASGGTFNVIVRPVASVAVGPTNPNATMVGRLYSFSPIGGAVGDAAAAEISIRNAGTAGLVMATA
jgi:hypothetical protein